VSLRTFPKGYWLALAVGGLVLATPLAASADKDAQPKTREFHFTYQAAVTGLEPGQTARIWLPVPPSNDEQQVTVVKEQLPAKRQRSKDAKYGNQILFVEARAGRDGTVPLTVTYHVKRREVKADLQARELDKKELEQFLKPDALVPLGGKPLTLLGDRNLPRDQLQLGRVFYDVVNAHMRYSKEGTGWGNGDAVWACDSKYGNCSDFHSLFISLARSHQMPARFEIGFPLPEKPGEGEIPGYHCWARFRPDGKGWVPVDISEANKNPKLKDYYFGNLSADRVTFSEGRDLVLEPKQDGPPLNFFVYPYVEVGGKPYPTEKVQKKFMYKDVAAER
jgi:hypothetical protein